MKKTNLLILAAASLLGLAACGGTTPTSSSAAPATTSETPVPASSSAQDVSSEDDSGKIKGIEGFCAYFETSDNYSLQYDENNYDLLVKINSDCLMEYYSDEMKEWGYVDGGYFSVADKGLYTIYDDGTGTLEFSDIYSINDELAPADTISNASIFADAGDEVWKDTDNPNQFKSTNGKMKTLACELCGWSSYEDYMTSDGVTLNFDDVNDIKSAELSFVLDCREDFGYEDAYFECEITIFDMGTTVIDGLTDLRKNPEVPEGIPADWGDVNKAIMEYVLDQDLPTMDWSYASYCYLDEYDEFNVVDLKGAGKGAAYGEKLEDAGWTYDEYDSVIDEDYGCSVLYYTMDIEVSDDHPAGGYYIVEIDDYSASFYALYGDDYAALYPEGSLQIVAYAVEYTTYEEFLTYFGEDAYYASGAVIATPSFTETPTNIIFTDNSLIGYYYYGMTEWYVFNGEFSSLEVAEKELTAWTSEVCDGDEWTLDDSEFEDTGYIYCLYDMYHDDEADADYCYLQVTIAVDLEGGTGAFMIDIEGVAKDEEEEESEEEVVTSEDAE